MPAVLENIVRDPDKAAKPASGKPSMTIINFLLDAAMFLNLIFIMWVTALLQFVFPPATEATGWSLWGLAYNEWRTVQFGSICVFALLAVEHVVLHWNWICTVIATRVLRTTKPDEASQAVYGVGTFIVILITVMGTLVTALAMVTH